MRRSLPILGIAHWLALALITLSPPAVTADSAVDPPPLHPGAPELSARNFLLMDFNTGQVLAEKAADRRVEPASLTKLMTAYVTFRELNAGRARLSDLVTVSKKAWRTGGSRMFINVNSKVKIEDLLQGMIVQSGNDASVALAEHLAGDEATFAAEMTRQAQRLGMTNSHFENSTGLPSERHYASARDVGILATALIREFPEYYRWYSQREYTYNDIRQFNRNKLLWRDASADGLKTGYTQNAGYCLVSSAQRDGMRLIAVVMGAQNAKVRVAESRTLLNYGFRFFVSKRMATAGEAVTGAIAKVWKGAQDQVPVAAAQDIYVTVPRGAVGDLGVRLDLQSPLIAPLSTEQTIGAFSVTLGEQVIAQSPLQPSHDIQQGGLWRRTKDAVRLWFEE